MTAALAVACLGRGGTCKAVIDLPLTIYAPLPALAAALHSAGWGLVSLANPSPRFEVRCAVCLPDDLSFRSPSGAIDP